MRKVLITTDSCCDLTPELYEKYDIKILPLTVTLGDKDGYDSVDVFKTTIYDYVKKTGILPKTAARSVGNFQDFFKPFADEGYDIVFIGISSDLSSTVQNAEIAAGEIGNVWVVDSRNLSTGIAHSVLAACDMRDEGKTAKEIAEHTAALTSRVNASFIIDSIDYLYKGGRCSALAALGANLLKLHPCIEVKNGKMGVGKKYRGRIKEIFPKYIEDRLTMDGVKYDRKRVFITHSSTTPGFADECVEAVKNTGLFDEVYETFAGATISSHCGPDTLGVLFVTDKPL